MKHVIRTDHETGRTWDWNMLNFILYWDSCSVRVPCSVQPQSLSHNFFTDLIMHDINYCFKLSSKQNYITKNPDIEIFFGKPVV